MPAWRTYLEQQRGRFLEEYLELLRIPSVSSLPEHVPDVQGAAEWVARRLERAGIEQVVVLPTGGHPVVYGAWLHATDAPTILIYGHFDTQPVDPLDGWTTPPFEPALRDGRVYARGASDDKGSMLAAILAAEALLSTSGGLPVNLKFLLEGQEEIGSPQIPHFLEAERERFACDMVFSADSLQWSEQQPCLLVGTKGLAAVQIDVRGPASDLHSGLFGGVLQNPIHALVHILDSMREGDGTIAVDGFLEAATPLSEQDRAQIAAVPFDEAAYRERLGVPELVGEPGYSTLERNWARPTLEVNGIWGGFQGAGVKTVIPATAHAKITCRLVAGQEPEHIIQLLTEHVRSHTPPGAVAHVQALPGRARPNLTPLDHPGVRAAHRVLAELYGVEPLYVRAGGSVPITELFVRILNVDSIGFGFALDDEQFHAPNEFFRLSSFERGQIAYCMLLAALGRGEE